MEQQVISAATWLTTVLGAVAANPPACFAGFGLVLYAPPMNLPVTPLVPPGQTLKLPCRELAESVELLRRLSDSDCPLHDGFHLIDANTLAITHLCQFFAPPIPSKMPRSVPNYPVGARFMAALLGSLLPSVVMTSVLGEREGAIAIERGVIRPLNVTAG